MLTLPEKIIFAIAVLITLYLAYRVIDRIIKTIHSGQGDVDWGVARNRLMDVLKKTITLQPVFRLRFWPSFFHGLVAWGFIYFLLINLGDVLRALFDEFQLFGNGLISGLFRLGGDVLSVGVLIGMSALLVRRFILKPSNLTTRQDILLNPKARSGILRDSAIVGVFILVHIGARFIGESFIIAIEGGDPWQPFASIVANLWSGWSDIALVIGAHIAFWLAIGSILIFIPYFLYSKHIHLFFAPLNFLLKPKRKSIGELGTLDFDDENIEQFGATHLEDLGWEQIMDSYACIMCYRCQEVCPAYNTGKVLSPAALEINKRYFLNYQGANIARGERSEQSLLEFAITPEAVWACTACGACIDICPVGNEPMRDILDIRRALVLMENDFPEQLQTAFRGMERTQNPWNVPVTERMKWAEGLSVPTIEKNPEFDILWWVGCAPSTDARAQKTAQALAKILNKASVNYAVLGEMEGCTGDSARRAGNEYLFYEMALANIEILNEVSPKRIVTTCPHCLHTIKNEYPAFGGQYEVIHHTELISELVASGNLELKHDESQSITFHDPCYLGRQNDILVEPRRALEDLQVKLIEMPRHGNKSFCCGAGGGQMWKEEERGDARINAIRFEEAKATGANTLAVGCPFCMVMLNDAKVDSEDEMQVLDVAEIVAQAMEEDS